MPSRRRWRPRSNRDCQSCADGSYFPGAGAPQHGRARFHRRAGGNHIVHEHHGTAAERGGNRMSAAPAHRRESVPERVQAARARQIDLPARVAPAPERGQDGETQAGGEVVRLIEAPAPAPERVQRNRHRDVGLAEPVTGGASDEFRQRPCERAPSFVLEGVDDLAQGARVHAGRPARRARAAGPFAVAAQDARGDVSARDLRAAAAADGWPEAGDPTPAIPADDLLRRGLQQVVAGGAPRRPDHGQDGIERLPQGRLQQPGRLRQASAPRSGLGDHPPADRSDAAPSVGISMRVALPQRRSRS